MLIFLMLHFIRAFFSQQFIIKIEYKFIFSNHDMKNVFL